MPNAYRSAEAQLRTHPRSWVVTGGAGFIGSHLVQRLLFLGQRVTVVDDFSTGRRDNLRDAVRCAGDDDAEIDVIELDLGSGRDLADVLEGHDVVLHQAALGSIQRSFDDPGSTYRANALGTFNLLVAARDRGIARVVFASSSSVYGDSATNPRIEGREGRPLSPYAATKRAGEHYMDAFAAMGLVTTSLRYFNVFGPRQNALGGYSAVIPRWIEAGLDGRERTLYGDGRSTRSYCHVDNVVRANVLAATAPAEAIRGRAFNIGCEAATSLEELHGRIAVEVERRTGRPVSEPTSAPGRPADVLHSRAVIDRARNELGYEPHVGLDEGLGSTVDWYADRLAGAAAPVGEDG